MSTLASGISITGYFKGTANFGSTTLTAKAAKGASNLFVARLDSAGKFVWAAAAGGTRSAEARSIFVDGSGKAIVAGLFKSSVGFGSTTLTSKGGDDAFVTILDPQGKFLWADSAGGTGNEGLEGITFHSPGHLCVIGTFSGSATFEGKTVTSKGGDDLYIWRTAPPVAP